MDNVLKHKRQISKAFLGKAGIHAVGSDGVDVILYTSDRNGDAFKRALPQIKKLAKPYVVRIKEESAGEPRFASFDSF